VQIAGAFLSLSLGACARVRSAPVHAATARTPSAPSSEPLRDEPETFVLDAADGFELLIGGAGTPAASPCVAAVELSVRNDNGLDAGPSELSVQQERSGRVFVGPERLRPSEAWRVPVSMHVSGRYRIAVSIEAQDGALVRLEAAESGEVWRPYASSQCHRRLGASAPPGTCSCDTDDAGKACFDGRDCEGPCLWDRTRNIESAACKRPKSHGDCSDALRREIDVGHCAALKLPLGCATVIEPGAADHSPRRERAEHSTRCWATR
jgi:hypothetical protein